jgi:hypothetical protein
MGPHQGRDLIVAMIVRLADSLDTSFIVACRDLRAVHDGAILVYYPSLQCSVGLREEQNDFISNV